MATKTMSNEQLGISNDHRIIKLKLINKYFICIFFIAHFSLLIVNLLPAQQSESFMETRFIQRLTWTAADNVRRYEVEIQRQLQSGAFTSEYSEFTTETFIEVSLPPGNYRYRITPYNLFNRPGRSSTWSNFTIHPALTPQIDAFTPESFMLSENETEYVLEIAGSNIIEGSLITLRRAGLNTQPITPFKTEILPDGNSAVLYFNNEQLASGIYLINIKNPGGMETTKGDFLIESETDIKISYEPFTRHKSLEIYWLASWMPLIPIYHAEKQLFDENISLAGTGIRFGVVSAKEKFFNHGLELSAAWNIANAHNNETEALLQKINLDLNVLFRKYLPNPNTAITFRLGAGYTLLPDLTEKETSLSEQLHITAGFSFYWAFSNHVFIETGIDHTNYFTSIYTGSLRPWIGIGMKM